MTTVQDVTFISVWDGGYEIETSAKYDPETDLVYDIEVVEGNDDEGDEVETLDKEYIQFATGEKLDVSEYNGKYRTQPPVIHLHGTKEQIDSFRSELSNTSLERNEVKLYSNSLEVIVQTLSPEDFETVKRLGRKHTLTSCK